MSPPKQPLTIIGAGYVGLVTGSCFAELGHHVAVFDNNLNKINKLQQGHLPIYEPGLEEMVERNLREGRLTFVKSLKEGVRHAEIIFIAVGTPSKSSGEADLSAVEQVVREIAEAMPAYRLIVEKSTVPVETGQWIKHTLKTYAKARIPFDVASNPEFLREGSAIHDFMHPDRIVLGVESERAHTLLTELYEPLKAPLVITDIKSAELIKHASNSFLAMRISFINAIAQLCERVGADVTQVAEGMGLDKRIGRAFLDAGVGFGGSCFPKDLEAFIAIAGKLGYDFQLLKAVQQINRDQRAILIKKVQEALWVVQGKTIGILGLAFKANTDDLRNAPALDVIERLQAEGATIRAYDPKAMASANGLLPAMQCYPDPYQVAEGADCLVILTDWEEFKDLDLTRIRQLLRQPLVIDGRNLFDPERMAQLGFRYLSVGRLAVTPPEAAA